MTEQVVFLITWSDSPNVLWFPIRKLDKKKKAVGQVKWRGTDLRVTLCFDSLTNWNTISNQKRITPSEYYPLLKSNLQKQIRRGMTVDALKTATVMWEDEPFSLLWRICVIAAEDSELFQEISVLIWLMAAYTKGLVPNNEHLKYTLKVIYHVSNHKKSLYYTICDKVTPYYGKTITYAMLKGNGRKDVLRSFLFRLAYGGMTGDQTMIMRTISYYYEMGVPIPKIIVDEPVIINSRLKVLQASADFHVNPVIINDLVDIIKSKGIDCTPDQMRQAIWEQSSRRNIRIAYPPSDKFIIKVYDLIRVNFELMADGYIKRVLG